MRGKGGPIPAAERIINVLGKGGGIRAFVMRHMVYGEGLKWVSILLLLLFIIIRVDDEDDVEVEMKSVDVGGVSNGRREAREDGDVE